jgi:rhodanese-related sulfurtransferase
MRLITPSILVKMMECSDLGTLLINRQPIELIDIRSKNEFAEMHIPGARSLPFRELTTPRLFRRLPPTTRLVCVVSADGHAKASLSTGILRSAGCINAVPLRGGMSDWVAQGLPVFRKRSFNVRLMVSAGAALAGLGAAAAFELSEALVGTILLIIMVALATKTGFILRNEYLADLRESTHFGSNKVRLKLRYHSPHPRLAQT